MMSGPSPRILVTATQSHVAAATVGIIHTSEGLVRLRGTPLDCATEGIVCSSISHCELQVRLASRSQLDLGTRDCNSAHRDLSM